MNPRPAAPSTAPGPDDRGSERAWKAAGVLAMLLLVAVAGGLVGLVMLRPAGMLGAGATPSPTDGSYLVEPRPAPPLDLVDQDGRPFDVEGLRGEPALVFFGYTHCPDVCPATVGIITQALAEAAPGPRAVFVTVDPERDDAASLKSYLRYLDPAFVALTGSPTQVRETADAWGVRYAKVDEGSASGYSMSHTASVYLLDAGGRIRGVFPFGTDFGPIAEAVATLQAEAPVPSPAASIAPPSAPTPDARPSATPTPAPAGAALAPVVVSSSVFSGGSSPVILQLFDAAGAQLAGPGLSARVQLTDPAGGPVGREVEAVVVRPVGVVDVSVVATLDIPAPGRWGLRVTAADGPTTWSGATQVTVLDPGGTAALGAPAPAIRTPTLDSVGGLALAVTTAPMPDLRLSRTSTVDATAGGRPYVLLVDSYVFKVSPACGRALVMARFLPDRWTDVTFIHLEPFEYTIAGTSPVIRGSLEAPVLNEYARGWGLGSGGYTPLDVPWIFIVDRHGIVRAKSTGIVGTPDVDVILTMLEALDRG